MTAVLAVRQDQDWSGFVVVLGILAVCLLVAWLETRGWFHEQDRNLQRIVDEGLARIELVEPDHLVDHVECANPDCDQTICACRQPGECTGCTTLGCDHGQAFCWDCRWQCRECTVEEHTRLAIDWAAGR